MKKTIYLLIILLSLTGLAYFLDQNTQPKENVVYLDIEGISDIVIRKKSQDFTLQKLNKWCFIEGCEDHQVDQAAVNNYLLKLGSIKFKRKIDSPSIKDFISRKRNDFIEIKTNDSQVSYKITLGQKSAISEDYYLAINNNIYLVSPYYKLILFPNKSLFEDKKFIREDISDFSIHNCKFIKVGENWDSNCGRPDQDNVINFIKMVSGMRYEARMSKDIFDHINGKIDREKISTLIGISNQRYSYFIIDSRLIGLAGGKAYIFGDDYNDALTIGIKGLLNKRIFNFDPKEVRVFKTSSGSFRFRDGLYFDVDGAESRSALAAIFEIAYLKYKNIDDYPTDNVINKKNIEISFDSKKIIFDYLKGMNHDYIKYGGKFFALEKKCCKSLKKTF